MNELKPENKNRPSSEEILKSLELCDSGYSSVYDYETQINECKKCVYHLLGSDCVLQAIHDALALLREKDAGIAMMSECIERQDKEIAQKNARIEELEAELKEWRR